MNRLDELEAKLKHEAGGWTASPQVEANLLNELTAQRWGQGFRPAVGLLPGVFGIAALAACLLFALWPAKPKPVSKPQPAIAQAAKPEPTTAVPVQHPRRKSGRKTPKPDAPEFIRIPYTTPLEPGERAEIVRVELPVSALASTGLRIATPDTSAKAQADLIVGEDGMARAIRLISILNNY